MGFRQPSTSSWKPPEMPGYKKWLSWWAGGLALAFMLGWGSVAAGNSSREDAPAASIPQIQPTPDSVSPGSVGAELAPVAADTPGVNLLPIVRNFRINTAHFTEASADVADGCVTPGEHFLLRFDFLVHNAGLVDLVIGDPAEASHLFVRSVGHDHLHLRDFNEYRLFDREGRQVIESYKQAFCLFDSQRLSEWARLTRQFIPEDCDTYQGLSAGWADLYPARITCQFIAIDQIPDGDYAFVATTNSRALVDEVNYGDNRICIELSIRGYSVTEVNQGLCQNLVGQLPVLKKPVPRHLLPCNLRRTSACVR